MKKGDVIINPFYCGRDVPEDNMGHMLCVVEKIFKTKTRRGGIAYRLVTIKGGYAEY